MVIKSPKAASAAECLRLEQLPNVGPAIVGGVNDPSDDVTAVTWRNLG